MKRILLLVGGLTTFLLFASAVQSQNKIYKTVSNDTVEKILQGLELKFQKEERKNKDVTIVSFDFKRGDHSFRLFNYQSDLWIECTFEKKLKAEDINRWNAEAKFSRLVLIEQKDKTIARS